MVTIGDRPLLDIWLDAFDRAGVDEVLVNLHHLPDVVRGPRRRSDRARRPCALVFEPELLGSAGTLRLAGSGSRARRCSWPATRTT